ncbi:MAG TPA: HAD family hydrolase [Patescibacteria group bacterium]|nr:HAD family hydrolase [Patescibacteria group bacterium]
MTDISTKPWVAGLRAISFDFGNTLVPVRREDFRVVVTRMTTDIAGRSGPFGDGAFETAWLEEGQRQFAEDVPRMQEVDLAQRTIRVLARLRGMPTPESTSPWDDRRAATYSEPDEVAFALESYSRAFVATIEPPPEVGPLLERLARRYALAICSNWPLGSTLDRFVDAAGWAPYLSAVVVSQRVGTIKPDPRIFRATEAALGLPADTILHVGDDWSADVVGGRRAGWRVAYLETGQPDSPFPASRPNDDVAPDLRLDRLADLEVALAIAPG